MENTMAQVLNIQAALDMLGGDKPLLKELLISFIKDTVFDEQKLLDLEKLPDTQEAGKYVHLFKGAGRQLGAERLGESGQALEDVLRGKKEGAIPELTASFITDYKLTLAAVNDALEIL
jgi:HPt (histidine-containing phosphotransfer) domain-containing protein